MNNCTPKLKLFLPLFVDAITNIEKKPYLKRKRKREQKAEIYYTLLHLKIEKPCKITFIRCGGRKMDDDNLIHSFKYIKDAVAEHINPGLPIGKADDDPLISWEYKQETKGSKGMMIIVH